MEKKNVADLSRHEHQTLAGMYHNLAVYCREVGLPDEATHYEVLANIHRQFVQTLAAMMQRHEAAAGGIN